jgi:hypothetical protein
VECTLSRSCCLPVALTRNATTQPTQACPLTRLSANSGMYTVNVTVQPTQSGISCNVQACRLTCLSASSGMYTATVLLSSSGTDLQCNNSTNTSLSFDSLVCQQFSLSRRSLHEFSPSCRSLHLQLATQQLNQFKLLDSLHEIDPSCRLQCTCKATAQPIPDKQERFDTSPRPSERLQHLQRHDERAQHLQRRDGFANAQTLAIRHVERSNDPSC